jgi:hypothetical protein
MPKGVKLDVLESSFLGGCGGKWVRISSSAEQDGL